MFYDVEWTEHGSRRFHHVFKAPELSILAKSLRYMNWERNDTKLPQMEKILITELDEYEGEFMEVTGNYQPGLNAVVSLSQSREKCNDSNLYSG